MIERAAIKINDKIYIGRKHSDIIRENYKLLGQFTKENSVQGFVDENGKFYTRVEAYEHAVLCGQVEKKSVPMLMSEDLY